MLRRTEGIVLRSVPYGEADLIVTFITLDFGIATAFAKSPRKTKSRFGSSLEPLSCLSLSLMGKENSPMPRLTQADIARPFQGLREDLRTFLICSEMAELTLALMPEWQPSVEAYGLFKESLVLMEEGAGREFFSLLYKVRLLGMKGYAPGLGGCARCGKESYDFYPFEGSVMCRACAGAASGGSGGGRITLSPGSAKLYGAMAGWDLGRARRLRASDAMLGEIKAMLDAHIEHTLSRPLKSRGLILPVRKGTAKDA